MSTKKMKISNTKGTCRYCGIKLINWDRVHTRDLSDAKYTFEALKHEMWRHYYWHIEIDQKAVNHALRKGKIGMREAAYKRIRNSVGSAELPFDGRQTPKTGNALFYAQHAIACCCRKCIEEWHGIRIGTPLSEDQIRYFADLVMLYINERLPYLTEDGERIPPQRAH